MGTQPTAWCFPSESETAERLGADGEGGLTSEEATRRRQAHGANRIAGKPPRSPWLLFFGQFRSVLILVLIFAAGLAATIGNVKDAVVILVVVILNAIVGFWQELCPGGVGPRSGWSGWGRTTISSQIP